MALVLECDEMREEEKPWVIFMGIEINSVYFSKG
jgi:hypothetical protein